MDKIRYLLISGLLLAFMVFLTKQKENGNLRALKEELVNFYQETIGSYQELFK